MAKMSERMNELKANQARVKADQAGVKETIAALKERLAQAQAEAAELKAQAAKAKEDIKAEREAEKERKAKAKEEKAKAKAEKAAKPKTNRAKKEKPQPKQEERKESPRAFEDRIAREVASELVNKYKLNDCSTLEEIKGAARKFNMDNHPDLGGCPTKCKIGNMYLQAMMRKAGQKRPEFKKAA
jgi:chromosome segregation ATPase